MDDSLGSTAIVTVLGFGLAYANGANDVSKGIATLVGAGLSDYRRAIQWGTAWTAVGGLVASVLATAMLTTFGNGLLTDGTTQTFAAAASTLVGAGAWVLLATRTGLPISTTHAIVGSLVGVATIAYGAEGVRFGALGTKVLLPLLLTPVLSMCLVVLLLKSTKTSGSPADAPECVCMDVVEPALVGPTLGIVACDGVLPIAVGSQQSCEADYPRAARITLDQLHWLTAGAASFARGMNDAPKIVALVLAASTLGGTVAIGRPALFVVVTAGMVAGSLVAGQRVTRLLAEKVTPMDHREGFVANLITAVLVTIGATLGLPMSTTHVSSGGIIGAGAQRASLNRDTLEHMVLAWVVTLPAAALFGIVVYSISRTF